MNLFFILIFHCASMLYSFLYHESVFYFILCMCFVFLICIVNLFFILILYYEYSLLLFYTINRYILFFFFLWKWKCKTDLAFMINVSHFSLCANWNIINKVLYNPCCMSFINKLLYVNISYVIKCVIYNNIR